MAASGWIVTNDDNTITEKLKSKIHKKPKHNGPNSTVSKNF